MSYNIVVFSKKLFFGVAGDFAKLIIHKSNDTFGICFGDDIALFYGFFVLF
jgi:hypothetical protein